MTDKYSGGIWGESLKAFRSQLQAMGEAQVRDYVATKKFQGDRLVRAQEWLRELDESRASTRDSQKQLIDTVAAIAAIVAAVAATIGAIASIIILFRP